MVVRGEDERTGQNRMKIAILVLVVMALLGPGAIRVIAYKLKGPWSNPQIHAAGAAVRWGAIVVVNMLIAVNMLT
jgi:hypothetical protein